MYDLREIEIADIRGRRTHRDAKRSWFYLLDIS